MLFAPKIKKQRKDGSGRGVFLKKDFLEGILHRIYRATLRGVAPGRNPVLGERKFDVKRSF